MKFEMEMEPHTPRDMDRPCKECVLAHGPMCLDRSYCSFKTTGKTWRKKLENDDADSVKKESYDLSKLNYPTGDQFLINLGK